MAISWTEIAQLTLLSLVFFFCGAALECMKIDGIGVVVHNISGIHVVQSSCVMFVKHCRERGVQKNIK